MRLRAAARSDVGRCRTANEDAFALAPELGLFLVADGMGGHVAGQVASQLAVRTAVAALEALDDAALPLSRRLQRCVVAANQGILDTAEAKPELRGMGTTLVALLAGGGRLALAHVGDSRAYLSRGGRLHQLTDDHTLVGELLRRGELSRDDAGTHPQRHVLTRALGAARRVEADFAELTPQVGDVILLCSDGLTQHVSDEELAEQTGGNEPLNRVCDRLIALANERGGSDNITVTLVRCEADGP